MAKYIMQEMNDLHREGKTLLYPRIIIRNCCGTDELVERAAEGTTLNDGEINASIIQLAKCLAQEMAKGRSVRIEGIGLFTPSLALRKGKQREEASGEGTRRNASSIEVGNVHFRPDKELIQETNSWCRLERQSGRFRRYVSKYTPEERLALAKAHLEKYPMLRIGEYAELTGLNRCAAGKELRRWYETPGSGIDISGRGAHRVYVKREEKP